jgi:hypothetical protein
MAWSSVCVCGMLNGQTRNGELVAVVMRFTVNRARVEDSVGTA